MEEKKQFVIPMGKKLYSRKYCNRLAKRLLAKGKISGMTLKELACEIYAHAYVYFNFRFVPPFLRGVKPFRSVYKSVSDGVDLEDGGDKLLRRIGYRVIWILPAFPIREPSGHRKEKRPGRS